MAKIIRSEWHQLERRYSVEVNRRLLKQVYPEYNESQILKLYDSIMSGNTDIKEVMTDAEGLDIVWDHECDDLWTDRKGGYDITFQLSVED
jgi:hypothetical protein